MSRRRITRSDRFLQTLAKYQQVVIASHDNPDPDAIAAAWAIRYLVEHKQGRSPRMGAGGATPG